MMIDLTRTITPGMPVYPGTAAPALSPAATLVRDGFRETLLTMTSHTGTHMDAPAHLLQTGSTLDTLPVCHFCGRAAVVDASSLGEGGVITAEFLRARSESLRCADFVLFYTGWEEKWGTEAYLSAYPVPDEEAARYLVSCGLKGVGTDAIGIDAVADGRLSAHRVLLGGGLVVVENLCLRRLVGRRDIRFFALPLKFAGSDGAPVRAVAELGGTSEKECEG